MSAKIVGGAAAQYGRYPYIVSLRAGSSHFCGGSLIHSRYALAARFAGDLKFAAPLKDLQLIAAWARLFHYWQLHPTTLAGLC